MKSIHDFVTTTDFQCLPGIVSRESLVKKVLEIFQTPLFRARAVRASLRSGNDWDVGYLQNLNPKEILFERDSYLTRLVHDPISLGGELGYVLQDQDVIGVSVQKCDTQEKCDTRDTIYAVFATVSIDHY